MESNKIKEHLNNKTLKFSLKGNRSYVQGPDIFNSVVELLSSENTSFSNFDIAFHRMVDRDLLVLFDETNTIVDPVSVCSFSANGSLHRIHLIEVGEKIDKHIPFSEEQIIDQMVFSKDNNRVDLDSSLPFSNIEIWVSMIKLMHQKLYSEIPGKWILVRGKFPQFTQDHEKQKHSVILMAKFGHKLTKSDVYLNSNKAGEIFFSLV